MKDGIKDKDVAAIDKENALSAKERIEQVVSYIIEHYDQKTKRNTNSGKYEFRALTNIKDVAKARDKNSVQEEKTLKHLSGFNSMFCVQSIETAIKYYNEFKRQLAEHPEVDLKVGMIYSFGANEAEDENGFVDDENSDDTSGLDVVSRDYLESAIKDYNAYFKTDYDTSADKFQNYYKDVSLRMKNKELDILIVVNMFLTGFDVTTLNTLWVDKNLKMNGLIQAYSRTNRILNSIKTFGNIVCFRDLSEQTDEATEQYRSGAIDSATKSAIMEVTQAQSSAEITGHEKRTEFYQIIDEEDALTGKVSRKCIMYQVYVIPQTTWARTTATYLKKVLGEMPEELSMDEKAVMDMVNQMMYDARHPTVMSQQEKEQELAYSSAMAQAQVELEPEKQKAAAQQELVKIVQDSRTERTKIMTDAQTKQVQSLADAQTMASLSGNPAVQSASTVTPTDANSIDAQNIAYNILFGN
ncbi:MAG: hypothetical protein SPK18_06765 [Treponema sp.]|nr:hypothetical protein [Treponema sp.]MDY5758266.1 hypothetical protein [Treponema sp.]